MIPLPRNCKTFPDTTLGDNNESPHPTALLCPAILNTSIGILMLPNEYQTPLAFLWNKTSPITATDATGALSKVSCGGVKVLSDLKN
jgi:hypothetical protein